MTQLPDPAERFRALGHPARLEILRCLVQGPAGGSAAGDIQLRLGIPASTLSHHLATLSAAGLVGVLRRGTFLLYRAELGNLRQLTDFLWQDCCSVASREPARAVLREPAGSFLDVEED